MNKNQNVYYFNVVSRLQCYS